MSTIGSNVFSLTDSRVNTIVFPYYYYKSNVDAFSYRTCSPPYSDPNTIGEEGDFTLTQSTRISALSEQGKDKVLCSDVGLPFMPSSYYSFVTAISNYAIYAYAVGYYDSTVLYKLREITKIDLSNLTNLTIINNYAFDYVGSN